MGQLVIAAAGAAVGWAVPGIGVSLGWTAGSILGSLLFKGPDNVKRVQSPTLNDLRVFGSEYGQAIPWGRGTVLTAGQIWWNSDRRGTTTITETREGGKGGGPEQVTVTTITTYDMDLLIGFTDLPAVGIGRIWENGGLIYNALSTASSATLDARGEEVQWDRLTFYSGDDGQLPDPDYEAEFGVGNVPAYLFRSSVFIKGLKLGRSGALRNLTFEVVIDGTLASVADWTLRHQSGWSINGIASDAAYGDGLVAIPGPGYTFNSADDGVTWTEYNRTGTGTGVGKTGAAVAWGVSETVGGRFVDVEGGTGWDGNTQSAMWSTDGHTWTRAISGFNTIGYTSGGNWRIAFDEDGAQWVAVHSSNVSQVLGLFSCKRTSDGSAWTDVTGVPRNVGWHDIAIGDSAAVVVTSNTTVEGGGALTGQVIINLDDPGFLSWTYKSAAAVAGWNRVCYAGNNTFIATAPTGQMMRSTDRGQTWALVSGAPSRMWTDMDSNRAGAVVALSRNPASTDNAWISRDYGVTWEATTLPHAIRMRAIVWGDGRFIASGNDDGGGETGGVNSFLTLDFAPDVVTPTPPTLQEVMESLCERAGLASSQYDMSGLASITRPVHSLPVSQAGPIRATMDLLADTYYFDLSMSDKLYGIARGGASATTIPFEDLGAGLEGNHEEPLAWRVVNDMEMAAYRSITYRNIDNDYQVDTQMSDRLVSTLDNTIQNSDIPIGFKPAEAKEIVDVWTNDMVNSPLTTSISVLSESAYAGLEPADVVTLTDRAGNSFRCRITKREDHYPILKFDLIVENASITVSPGITDENYESSESVIAVTSTTLELLDIPCLRDADALSGAPYVAGEGADAELNWPGCVVYQSSNAVDYAPVTALAVASVIGVCQTTLGNWTGGRMFDEINKVRVNLGAGTVLTGSTRTAMLGDQSVNACLIGSELMQFRDATAVADGVYDLTGFLRGGRGTEWAVSGHAASERFVMLSASALSRFAMPNSQLGLELQYKAPTVGKALDSASPESFTCNGVALKPFNPVNARCSRDASNNATITWQRRTRLSVRMIGSAGISVPLGENTEQYSIDVYTSSAFTTVATTLTASSESVAFTAAAQTAAGLTPGNPLHVRVYQLSGVVGRGYALTATV